MSINFDGAQCRKGGARKELENQIATISEEELKAVKEQLMSLNVSYLKYLEWKHTIFSRL